MIDVCWQTPGKSSALCTPRILNLDFIFLVYHSHSSLSGDEKEKHMEGRDLCIWGN